MRQLLATATGCAVVALALVACGGSPTSRSGRPLVVTTTTQVTDFVRQVAGEYVDVYAVSKPNVDPHDYEPTPADVKALHDADVIVKNGVGLEGWFDATIKNADSKATIVDASHGVKLAHHDPHIWQNPRNASVMVANIAAALSKADPVDATMIDAKAAAYRSRLTALDRQTEAALAPIVNRKVVTNHDAFGYYLRRYNLTLIGSVIPSFDTQAELSARDVRDLVSVIKRAGVKAIFAESSLPPKSAQAIADEAGVKVLDGDDALYGDTLGPQGSDASTYIDMIRHNTKVLVANLA